MIIMKDEHSKFHDYIFAFFPQLTRSTKPWLENKIRCLWMCRIRYGKLGVNKWRCLQLWHTLAGDVHRKKANWWHIQGWLSLHGFVKAALPERLVDVVDPVLLWEREDQQGATRSNDAPPTRVKLQVPTSKNAWVQYLGSG